MSVLGIRDRVLTFDEARRITLNVAKFPEEGGLARSRPRQSCSAFVQVAVNRPLLLRPLQLASIPEARGDQAQFYRLAYIPSLACSRLMKLPRWPRWHCDYITRFGSSLSANSMTSALC